MTVKMFEVRDSMTFIPVLVVELAATNEAERFLLRRAGYSLLEKYHLLACIVGGGGQCSSDPYDFSNRTYSVALNYIHEHFDELKSGQVIDVQFINGETPFPKISEQFTAGGV